MAFPIAPVVKPTNLAGAGNGALPADLLVWLNAPGRPSARAHGQAARSWRALSVELARRFGLTLTVTSNADAYRSYRIQEATFRQRYVQSAQPIPGVTSTQYKTWNGQRWYKRLNVATAAVPGTSNHGWGLAFDACWWINEKMAGITTQPPAFQWLTANAYLYGFSWELQSEPWHIRLTTGDATPPAVVAYENEAAQSEEIVVDAKVQVLRPSADAQRGYDVFVLQSILNGIYAAALTLDGIYGIHTIGAVQDAQRKLGLNVDGICGPMTWGRLLNG